MVRPCQAMIEGLPSVARGPSRAGLPSMSRSGGKLSCVESNWMVAGPPGLPLTVRRPMCSGAWA